MSASVTFKALLASTTIESLLAEEGKSSKLVSVNSEQSLGDALKIMNENMIVSVPVIDGDKCVGVIDNVDVMNYLNKQFENIREWLSASEASVETVLAEVRVKEVIDFAHGDPLVVTGEAATCESVMKFFASGWSHRCVVNTKNGFAVISQYDIVKMLANAMKKNKELSDACESIILLDRLTSRSVTDETVTIGSTENVFSAMDRMVQKKVHALAVVDEIEDGKIVGNFSSTDLLNVEYGQFKEFALSVRQFLEKYSPTSLNPVTVEADGTSLANVMNLFAGMGLHRLWIVDSGSQTSFPLGVVSLTDVLKIVNDM
eukprot:TRINITY_DN227_c0_g1_i1.p1 TRINITY_DN227_c0_g1~~TRINITY_DN227_c0_g1_i1.p1  ORF type:complete len:316 (-),score=101.74 TRINITY_DN227_c0_g1_i1:73-1020(-)